MIRWRDYKEREYKGEIDPLSEYPQINKGIYFVWGVSLIYLLFPTRPNILDDQVFSNLQDFS